MPCCPTNAPFRAWSNFEFRDGQGKWHEVDLLVLGRRRLHLVELKYYSGTLRGDDLTWRRDGHRAEDSPLKLARRKAQRLASKLQDELIRWAQETGTRIPDVRDVVPFVQESVFLHHPGIRCLLPPASRIDLFGLDGNEYETGLPGISERLLEPPTPHQSVGANRDDIIAALMQRIGIVQRRQREAGSWVIDEDPLGEGDGWQDWPAFHRVATTERGRIRFLVTPPGATATDPGQDPPGRRARVPDHVAAGQRPAAAPAGPGGQRPRRRAGLPVRRPVPAARPVAGRPRGQRAGRGPAVAAAAGRRGGGLRARQPGRAPRPHPARRLGPATAGRAGCRSWSATGRARAQWPGRR